MDKYQHPVSKTMVLKCANCGINFIFRLCEQDLFVERGWKQPKVCPECRKEKRIMRMKEFERIKNEAWQKEKLEEQKIFEKELGNWRLVEKDEIVPENDNVLYILGNGFDLNRSGERPLII